MKRRFTSLVCFFLNLAMALAAGDQFEFREGGIIRGPTKEKKIALEFTADSFGEGGKVILDEFAKRKIKAAFFFTGNFLRNAANKPLIERVIKEGHYLGPHSDTHPLLCPWSG